jgi:cyclopropane-fatty-acyl-phospholipid synthase
MALFHIVAPLIGLAENGRLPDGLIRVGIRGLLRSRLKELQAAAPEQASENLRQFLRAAAAGPIACVPEKANEQHYEVPAEFFQQVLGSHRKYSCCYWTPTTRTLDDAEAESLRRTCEHAELNDGQTVLELGCGWGSLSLWMAQMYPKSQILAISNSHSQREYIMSEATRRGLLNLKVQTCDINEFSTVQRFDRVVSVEMFEHVRNHSLLLQRVSSWLNPAGKLFVHIFCHHRYAYLFEDTGSASWMARHFFSGGMMPSQNLFLNYQEHLQIEKQWAWDGTHYEKTSNAWLELMDRNRTSVEAVLKATYGSDWHIWRLRWRMFFMSCAELFGFNGGNEWFVAHYLFRKPAASL